MCLSLLNTWAGRNSEVWDPASSTILQVRPLAWLHRAPDALVGRAAGWETGFRLPTWVAISGPVGC